MQYARLKKQADFQKLFSSGKRGFSPSLTLLYRPHAELRMGISIGKKHGKAVVRNRIKRLIREAFREVEGEIKGTYSIVLVPKIREEYSFTKFKDDLRWIIRKEKL
ncbi:MAG: ribonuclease P protein component [Clostridia bacterium]|nr:ribonuclease P protein component [Clostridia bacterium]